MCKPLILRWIGRLTVESSVNQADDHEIYGVRLCTNHCTNPRLILVCPSMTTCLAWLTISTHQGASDTAKGLAPANRSKFRPLTRGFHRCSDLHVDRIRMISQSLGCQQETSTPEKLTGKRVASETPFLQNSIACPESRGVVCVGEDASPIRCHPLTRSPARVSARSTRSTHARVRC